MTVILRALMAGPDGVFAPGEKLTLSAEQERALVDGGFAAFDQQPDEQAVSAPPETATPPAAETATKTAPEKRRK